MLSAIIADTQYLPTLYINAIGSKNTTDNGLKILSSRLYQVKSLSLRLMSHRTLNVSDCRNITEKGIISISHTLRTVIHLMSLFLNFSGCNRVTDVGMQHLAQTLLRLSHLSEVRLHFSDCYKVNRKGVYDLLLATTNMKTLSALTLSASSTS